MIERDWSKPLNLEIVSMEISIPEMLAEERRQFEKPMFSIPMEIGIDKARPGSDQSVNLELPLMSRHFAGAGYRTTADHDRLEKQHDRIKRVMMDGRWRTLDEIHDLTGDPQASISAQLRHMRKQGFGNHTLNRNERAPGLYEYQIVLNPKEAEREAQKYYHKKHPKPFDIAI